MYEVTFQIEGQEKPVVISVQDGANLLETARSANVAIDAPCSGNVSCGKCRVKLVSGELDCPKTMHLSQEEYEDGWRLSCASKVKGDVVIFVPDIASAYKSRMQTADLSSGREIAIFKALQTQIQEAGISFENQFLEVTVTLPEPSLDDVMPDNERLSRGLQQQLGCKNVVIPYSVMKKLPKTLRDCSFTVTVRGQMRQGSYHLYDVSGQGTKPMCGAAIDIGTTTVSAVLLDLKTGALLAKASSGNGQIRYGADVINRIVEQGKPDGIKKLQDAIIKETIVPILAGLYRSAGVKAVDVFQLCVASNTTMNHLFVGVDANSVRCEPYIPAFFHWNGLMGRDLRLPVNSEARCLLAPNIGSYVGGDITAGTFASLMWDRDEFTLFIDLGTNGEIVFGNRDFLMSCACSAGPAFEGGDISCGMRATDGAIEAVTIDAGTMEPTLKVVGDKDQKPVGICGSGIIDIIAEMFRCGIINAKGQFSREGARVLRDSHGCGRYVLAWPSDTATEREISIDEVDIDNFIRAKGAIYSAIDTLFDSVDMDDSVVEQVLVAGGIGSGINMENAVRIGMFPDVPREKFRFIGNSSLSGAYAMVISPEAEAKVEEVAKNMTYMELSTHPGYMERFVAACFIPHTDAARFPSSVQEKI